MNYGLLSALFFSLFTMFGVAFWLAREYDLMWLAFGIGVFFLIVLVIQGIWLHYKEREFINNLFNKDEGG